MQRGPAAARELAGPQAPHEIARLCGISLRVGIERSGVARAMFLERFVGQGLELARGLVEAALPLRLSGNLSEDGLREGILFGSGEFRGGPEGFFEELGHGVLCAVVCSLDAEYTPEETTGACPKTTLISNGFVAAERCVQLQAIFQKARECAPSLLILKGFRRDGFLKHRACQLQQLVLRQAMLRTTSGYQKIIYVRISGPSRNKWPCGWRP